MLSLKISSKDMFLRVYPDVAVCCRGLAPELEWVVKPVDATDPQKFQGVLVGARILRKLGESVLVSLVFGLHLEREMASQLLVTFKKMGDLFQVPIKLRRTL
jgi:hypothetical protein